MMWNAFVSFVQAVRPVLEVLAIVATPIMAFLALRMYGRSVRLERAKWVKELHEKFYERPELKTARDVLDGGDNAKIAKMVHDESPEFTDYLNFFEFLGYLSETKQIGKDEITGMFDYYLKNLRGHESVLNYINNRPKGFEKLQALLQHVQ